MHPALYHSLSENPQLLMYLRDNPMWYRYLSRDPSALVEMEKEAREYGGKNFVGRLKKIKDQAEMVHMLFQLAAAMKD